MDRCKKCNHNKKWHKGKQKQSVTYNDIDNRCYPELFHKGNKYIRTCYGIGCDCNEVE